MVIREILESYDREIAAHKAAIIRIADYKAQVLTACKPEADRLHDAPEEGPAIAGRVGCQGASRSKRKAG